MSLDVNEQRSSESWLRHNRLILGVSAAVYLLWWIVVELLLPGSFNPLPSRLAICSIFLVVLALSFRVPFVKNSIDRFQALAAFLLTIHYFYLFHHNNDVNWVVGSYITVMAVGLTLNGLPVFIAYSILVLTSTWFVSLSYPSALIAIPGIVTILILLQIYEFMRRKMGAERQKRIKAEAERSSAEAVSRAKSLFLANMSHELRTPLTSIIGFSEILSDANELSTESRDSLERIRRNSLVLLETVNQILALTEDDFSRLGLNMEPLSIRDLVGKEMQEVEAKAKAKGIKLSLQVEAPFTDKIIGDPNSLARVLRNVLGNAIKFTESGEIAIRLSTKVTFRPDWLLLSIKVQDSGIGIEKKDIERVFEPFGQVQEEYTRAFGGSGLGLTVARKIARAMGGDVAIVDSQPGFGTEVQITVEAQIQ